MPTDAVSTVAVKELALAHVPNLVNEGFPQSHALQRRGDVTL